MKRELEPYQLIERSIIKKYRKELWTPFIVAVKRYELIQAGDKIAVCISGGKDSMLMAKLMQELQKHSDVPFELVFLVMDPGYNEINRQKIESNAELLHIPVTMCDNGGGGSKRQETKILLRRLKRDNPNIENSIFRSIHAVALDTMPGYKSEGVEHSFLERFHEMEERS